MVRACAVCGLPIPEGARFCPNCGAAAGPLVETEERKMVTVLFADLVDSTGLAQRLDAERSRELLGRFFDAASDELIALRGRPEKFIGDAVMAVFGLPHVHEDDALRAVRAGLAIRERVGRLSDELGFDRPLQVRIGIESGEAAIGRSPTGQLLVTGTVVNAAARLQAAAQVDQILVGATTQQLTATNVAYGRRRRVRAKGFDVSLDAYPVQEITARSARRTIPFVGRASEQAILGQSLGLASTTGRPVLVTVVGEAGIGKSRLAEELAAGVSAAVMILRGQSRSQTDTATFSPAATIIGDVAGIGPRDNPETIRARLRKLVFRTTSEAAAARTEQRLAMLFGLGESPDETAFVHEVQAGFISVIDGLARDHAVVLLFEDAQSLKAPMLDLIERVATRGQRPRRALVIALARGELLDLRPAWGSGTSNSVLIRLDALSRDESVQLARHAGGGRIGDVEALEIAERAGGNPYFIIETTGMLMPSGIGSDGQGSRSVPPTVQAVVSARLDALPQRLRELARRASVFKYAFDLTELGVVDHEATADELQALEEAEVIVRDPQPGEPLHWRLRHATLKEVIYASLPKRERKRLHELVAQFALALALRFLGDIAINFEADVDKAERLLSRSLLAAEQLGDPWAIVRSLLFAGWVPWTRERYGEAEAIWRRALDIVDPKDHWARVRALTALSINHSEMNDLDAALKLIEQACALAEDTGDQFSVANTSVQKARVLDDLGRAEEALPWFDRGVAIFSALGARWEMAAARAARGIAKRNLGRLDEAEEDLRYAIRIAEELGDRQLPAWTWRNLAKVAELRGDKAAAEELLRRSQDAESRGPH